MSSVGNLLSVVMDGITDVGMMLDCAIQDFDWVSNTTGLNEKVMDGDEIAKALHEHIQHEIVHLKNRM